MSACRRCSECRGQEHHWCSEIRTDDGVRLQCKHCAATADDCPECMGDDGSCAACGDTRITGVRP